MNTSDKAARAVEKSGLSFSYVISSDNAGRNIAIVNRDAFNPLLGKHTNDREMRLPIDSKMSITEITAAIIEKWKK